MRVVCDWAKTYAPLIGRLLITFIFLRSAYGKIVGFEAVTGMMAKRDMPFAEVFLAGAIALEIVGGLMILAGWHARIGALLLAIFLIPATLIFHNFWAVEPAQFVNQLNHFMKNLSILGALVFIVGMGSGPLSLNGDPEDPKEDGGKNGSEDGAPPAPR